jgi:outer membrane protein TolC
VIVTAGAVGVGAQSPTVTALTFEQAIDRALQENPTVAEAAEAITRATTLIDQARALTRPRIEARIVNTTLDTEQGFEGGVVVPQNQFNFTGTVSMPLLDPARWADRAQAGDQLEVASRSTIEARQQVATATAQAFLVVIAWRRQVEVEERALENAAAHYDYATTRFEGGVGSRLDQLRADQEVAVGEGQVERARFSLLQSQEALGVLVAADGPVDAADEPTFDIPASIDENMWIDARPDLRTQNAIILAAERIVRDSWKDVAPYGELAFDPQYVTPAGLFFPSRSWRLTFTVTQPIYLGGLQGAVKRERQVTFDESRLRLSALEIQARSEVRMAQASMRSSERMLVSARRAAEQAREVLEITTTAFEVGAGTNIEVIDAQRTARDLETAVTVLEDALQQARLDLLVAIGRFPG